MYLNTLELYESAEFSHQMLVGQFLSIYYMVIFPSWISFKNYQTFSMFIAWLLAFLWKPRTYLLLNYQQQKIVSKKNFLFEALDQLQENLPLLPVFGFLPIHSLCTAISLPGSENTNKANLILLIFFSFKNMSTLQFVTLCLQSFLFSFFYPNLKISSNQ